jgi:hypothetical protein
VSAEAQTAEAEALTEEAEAVSLVEVVELGLEAKVYEEVASP